MSKEKRKLAIFDIDGTIFRSSLLVEFFNELVAEGLFPKSVLEEIDNVYSAWLKRKGHYDDYINKLAEVHHRSMVGLKKADTDVVVKRMLENEREKVYRFTRDLVGQLKDKGYYMMAISGSPIYAVADFTEFMGFDVSFGSEQELVDGVFTEKLLSRPIDPVCSKKEEILRTHLKEAAIEPDWEESVMVGDSEGDLCLLELVGHPIAFNPSSGLAKYAKEKGWRIVVERKDVIYDLKEFETIPHSLTK